MGSMGKVLPVNLIVGMIFRDKELCIRAEKILKKRFGELNFESRIMNFDHTDYYEKEMGNNLRRKFISFKRLIKPERLAGIKRFSNSLETRFSLSGRRRINLDPGYLDANKLVLATTKDWGHRIYLKEGIYAEVTLYFQDNSFQSREWTYPDYKTEEYIHIFNHLRKQYLEKDLT
ncbi:MAG: DUF4416 family protein [Calditrichia bacterium]